MSRGSLPILDIDNWPPCHGFDYSQYEILRLENASWRRLGQVLAKIPNATRLKRNSLNELRAKRPVTPLLGPLYTSSFWECISDDTGSTATLFSDNDVTCPRKNDSNVKSSLKKENLWLKWQRELNYLPYFCKRIKQRKIRFNKIVYRRKILTAKQLDESVRSQIPEENGEPEPVYSRLINIKTVFAVGVLVEQMKKDTAYQKAKVAVKNHKKSRKNVVKNKAVLRTTAYDDPTCLNDIITDEVDAVNDYHYLRARPILDCIQGCIEGIFSIF